MIMADKITLQRKKNGWSQEELAERLDVSRQSVSKWESAQSAPDLSKVIAMAELFGVSTDYLLKDEVELPAAAEEKIPVVSSEDAPRKVSLEEANSFIAATASSAERISVGVLLCILSPILLIVLSAAGEGGAVSLSEGHCVAVGCITMMLLIAAAVFLFLRSGFMMSKYSYLEESYIDTEYGVTGLVKELRQAYEGRYNLSMTVGVMLCVLSAVPIFACVLVREDPVLASVGVSAALVMIAVGVWQIVKVSVVWGGFQKLLEEGDYSRGSKRVRKGLVSGIYWAVVVALYLGYSFVTFRWDRSWIIWPIAAVLYAVVIKIEEAVYNGKNNK